MAATLGAGKDELKGPAMAQAKGCESSLEMAAARDSLREEAWAGLLAALTAPKKDCRWDLMREQTMECASEQQMAYHWVLYWAEWRAAQRDCGWDE
jgi:hypothetical protein